MAGLCSLLFCLALPLRYALVTGFVVNELGVLTFHPDDLLRFVLQMAIATSGVAAGGVPALLNDSRGADARTGIRQETGRDRQVHIKIVG